MHQCDLFIHSIGELATPQVDGGPAHGKEMSNVERTKKAALAAQDGKVVAVGPEESVRRQVDITDNTKQVDARGGVVIPGFVDAHTHLIFAGNRSNEFLMRCQGKTYAEIANAGGGIVASMAATRKASLTELVQLGQKRLGRMLGTGTTTCEVKTGYGLDTESELQMMQAIIELSTTQPVQLVPTFMPAHAFPPGADRKAYIKDITDVMFPKLAKMLESPESNEQSRPFNDVFCDEGYFTLQETKEILEAGIKHGYRPKIHADEFKNLGASTLAVEIGAASADHLLNISDEEIVRMSESNTVAVLLPGTSFFLNLKEHAPARKMIESGVAVALGTDFNPGSCHIFSIPFIWGLACLHLKMTIEEVLTATTLNAAYAVGLGDRLGQLRVGYQADFLLLDIASLEEVPYNMGWNPVLKVFKRGQLVHSAH